MYFENILLFILIIVKHVWCYKLTAANDYLEDDARVTPFAYFFILVVCFHLFTSQLLVKRFNIPITPMVFVLIAGIVWGIIARQSLLVEMHMELIYEEYILLICYPVILFQMAFNIDFHYFKKYIIQICILCTIGQVILVAVLASFYYNLVMRDWSITYIVIFGLMVNLVYSNDVNVILSEAGIKTKHVRVLLEAESIVTAVLSMTGVLITMIVNKDMPSVNQGTFIANLVFETILLFLLGIVIGFVLGIIGALLFDYFFGDITAIIISTVTPIIMGFYIGVYLYHIGSGACIVTTGILLSRVKVRISAEDGKLLAHFWETFSLICQAIIVFNCGCLLSINVFGEFEVPDITGILIAFLGILLARLLALIVMFPILSRIEPGLTFGETTLLLFGAARSPLILMCAFLRVKNMTFLKEMQYISFINSFIFILYGSTILICTKLSIQMLGMKEISLASQLNMTNCVKHIMNKRETIVGVLKMDRMLSDANWPLVMNKTLLEHPYRSNLRAESINPEQMEQLFLGQKTVVCPECLKKIPKDLTTEEFYEMDKEVKMRLTKAKKLHYMQQFMQGTITRETALLLNEAVEISMDTDGEIYIYDVIQGLFSQESCITKFLKCLVELVGAPRALCEPPSKYWRRICYNIIFSLKAEIALYFFILVSVASTVLLWTVSYDNNASANFIMVTTMFTLVAIGYSIEIIFKLIACPYAFFRSLFCVLSFVITLVVWIEIGLFILSIWYRHKEATVVIMLFTILKMTRTLKVFRILSISKKFYQKLVHISSYRFDSRVAASYDVGKAFVLGEQTMIEMLDLMVTHPVLRLKLRSRLCIDRLAMLRELALVQKYRPWIPLNLKTKYAINTTIGYALEALKELKVAGWIDDIEYKRIMLSLNERLHKTNKKKHTHHTTPKSIFNEIPWMSNEDKTSEFLYQHVITKVVRPGQLLIVDGENVKGIFVLITGLLKLTYKADRSKLEEMRLIGRLPIMDFISTYHFEYNMEEYILPGNTFGELGVLTKQPSGCSVICEVPSQVMYIRQNTLHEAINRSNDPVNGLEARLWKYISMQLAVSLLIEIPAYQNLVPENVKFTLQRGFVPNISVYRKFSVNDQIEDLVLVQGVVADLYTREIYVAPCYLPRSIKKVVTPKSSYLKLPSKVETKLFVIPIKDADEYEVMTKIEVESELLPGVVRITFTSGTQGRKRKQRGILSIGRKHRTLKIADEGHRISEAGKSMRSTFGSYPSEIRSIYREENPGKSSILVSTTSVSQKTDQIKNMDDNDDPGGAENDETLPPNNEK